jgi:hypothetical protein
MPLEKLIKDFLAAEDDTARTTAVSQIASGTSQASHQMYLEDEVKARVHTCHIAHFETELSFARFIRAERLIVCASCESMSQHTVVIFEYQFPPCVPSVCFRSIEIKAGQAALLELVEASGYVVFC